MALHTYLAQDRLQALACGAELPERMQGAALFADIAGFTALTESLTEQHGERDGIEALTRIVGGVYDALIGAVEGQGGSTIGFAGDAILCWFDAGTAADAGAATQRALACAQAMQRAMRGLAGLALKVGVASGPARRFAVGDPALQRLDVLAGATVARAALAESLARPGEVLLDEAAASVSNAALLETRRAAAGAAFGVLAPAWDGAPEPAAPGAPPPASRPPAHLLRPWVLPVVFEREASEQQSLFATDLRPTVALFLGFDALDYDADAAAPARLDGLVAAAQRALQQHGGVLLELIVGDKGSYLYASFGAVRAHEDDARRAVRAALALRSIFAADAPAAARIGLASGTTRVGGYGSRTRRSFGAQGDTVNVAARLMGLARPSEILLSGRVRAALAGGHFSLEARAPIALKGKAEPMPVFALLGPQRQRAVRLQEPEFVLPMVGRESELALLARQAAGALAGRGALVAIVGEAGMGKSRLVAEGLRLALRSGFVGYGGAAGADGVRTPYRLWHGVWTAFFDLDPALPPRLQQRAVENALARRAPEHAEAWPLLGAAVGLELPDNAFTHGLAPMDRKALLETVLIGSLRAAAEEAREDGAGLLLVLEDLHHADALSLELLLAVARAVEALPVLMLLSQRPPERASAADALAPLRETALAMERIELGGLDAAPAEQLIRAKLAAQFPERGGAVPPALIARIAQRAHGNPFYIEELLNYLHDRGLDPRQPATAQALDWPASLRSLVLSRIDRLGLARQLTLKVASVIGRRFRLADLQGCHPSPGGAGALRADLDELDRLGLTPALPGETEPTFVFRHLVTLEVAYESLAQASRVQLHAQVAAYLEARDAEQQAALAPELAHHWARAERPDKACAHLLRAGEQAAAAFANDEALACFEQALHWLPADDRAARIETLLRCEAIHDLQGRHDARRNDLARLDALAAAPAAEAGLRSRIALRRAGLDLDAGDFAAARQGASAALAALGTDPAADPAAMAGGAAIDALLLLARALFAAGMSEDARAPLGEALARARERGDALAESSALSQLGLLDWQAGRYDSAEARLRAALPALQAGGELRREIDVLNDLGVVAKSRARFAEAVAHYERAQAIARRIGDRSGEAMLLTNIGAASLAAGDFHRALQDSEKAARLWAAIGEPSQHGVALLNQAEAQRELGQYVPAQALGEQALALFRACGMPRGEAIVLENLGRVAVALGEPAAAAARFDAALGIARAIGLRATEASTLLDIGRLHTAGGRLDEARAALRDARQLAAELGDPGVALEVCAARADLALRRAAAGDAAPTVARDELQALLPRLLAPADAGDGLLLPMPLYLVAWRVLAACGDERAGALLERARAQLRERGARIADAAARHDYLQVAEHRALLTD